MADRIQLRRDTAANWTAYNPILLEGEPGIEIDTDQWKLGDGVHTWSQLAYRGGECVQQRGQSTTVAMSQKAVTDELNLIGVFDISAHNLTDGQPTKYADLTAALGTNGANVPTQYRVPGMTVRYVQSSDNKYVQYRLMADEFTTDTIQWAIAEESVYVENPEFVYVKNDNEGKILWAIKTDGSIYYGAGVPSQVIDYINEKIAELSLEDIVAFLNDLEKGDKTLQTLLDEKVDKVEGKSLIDKGYADGISYIENPEFVEVNTDADDKILYGVKQDGDFYFGAGVPSQIQEEIDTKDAEFAEVAANKVDMEEGKSLIDEEVSESLSVIEDPEGRLEIATDSEDKIISYRKDDGTLVENVGIESPKITTDSLSLSDSGMTEFQQALKDSGFNPGGRGDWTEYLSKDGKEPLSIPIPRCAMLNIISDYDLTQLSKKGYSANPPYWPAGVEGETYDIPMQLEFWDMQGNYFKKWAIVSGQGNSSMSFKKKNIGFDLFDSEVGGDAFSVKFGNWVAQDSFHMKSYYTDFFRCTANFGYDLYDQISRSNGFLKSRPYIEALIDYPSISIDCSNGGNLSDLNLQVKTEARTYPDGFPVIIYQNGTFWGVYQWQLKKHRDNMFMEKGNPKHIHLDGALGISQLWDGSIDWTAFEVRNPKNIVYAEAHNGSFKYDADIAQANIAGNDDGSLEYDTWTNGSYPVNKIVEHNGHYYINSIANNTAEPIYHVKNNADDNPDFKNKTGCGWINCTNTIKVKEYIIKLSNRIAELTTLNVVSTTEGDITIGTGTLKPYSSSRIYSKGEWLKDSESCYMSIKNSNQGHPLSDTDYWTDITSTVVAIRQAYDTYFDSDGMLDYIIFSCLTRNYDGFTKNWQWVTWGSDKWYVCPYDLDGTFGNFHTGTRLYPPHNGWANAQDMSSPVGWCFNFFKEEIKSRYLSLKEMNIITADNIFSVAEKRIKRIGINNYSLEYKKWSESPCNRDSGVNYEYWEYTNNTPGNTGTTPAYSDDVLYQNGDSCAYSGYVFRAVKVTQGNSPIIKTYSDNPTIMGYRDNIYRLYKWIDTQVSYLDNLVENNNIN